METNVSDRGDVTEKIIGCAIEVHRYFGAGLKESIYRPCFVYELTAAGLTIQQGRRVPLIYKGRTLGADLIVDVVVEDCVLVELKAIDAVAPLHYAQVITYLKLTGLPIGLLINFNVPTLLSGVRRLVRPDLYRGRGGSRDLSRQPARPGTDERSGECSPSSPD